QAGKTLCRMLSSVDIDGASISLVRSLGLKAIMSRGFMVRQLSAIWVPDIPWQYMARLRQPPLAPSTWSKSSPASSSQTWSTPAWNPTLMPPPAMISDRMRPPSGLPGPWALSDQAHGLVRGCQEVDWMQPSRPDSLSGMGGRRRTNRAAGGGGDRLDGDPLGEERGGATGPACGSSRIAHWMAHWIAHGKEAG